MLTWATAGQRCLQGGAGSSQPWVKLSCSLHESRGPVLPSCLSLLTVTLGKFLLELRSPHL